MVLWLDVYKRQICGLSLKKEKSQRISWKRYSTSMLLVSVVTFYLLYIYDEHYELLYKFFLAIGVIGICLLYTSF